jgi:hypothetical protein
LRRALNPIQNTMVDRREFLKKLAKGSAYAAPMVYTLATPDHLAAITSGMIMTGMMGMLVFPWQEPPGSQPPNSAPPGSTSPGSPPTGSSTTGPGD